MNHLTYTGPFSSIVAWVSGVRIAKNKMKSQTRIKQMADDFAALYTTGVDLDHPPVTLSSYFSNEEMRTVLGKEAPNVIVIRNHPEEIQSRMSVSYAGGELRLVVDFTKEGKVVIYSNEQQLLNLDDSATVSYRDWLREEALLKTENA